VLEIGSKSCLKKGHKRGRTFSEIGRTFWLDWPESSDRTWQHWKASVSVAILSEVGV
jgi:hypothetical protein